MEDSAAATTASATAETPSRHGKKRKADELRRTKCSLRRIHEESLQHIVVEVAANLRGVRAGRVVKQRVEHDRLIDLVVSMREAAHMTQQELAERLGWKQQSVSRIEKGERNIEVVELIDICRILKRDPVEVFASVAGSAG